MNVKDHIEELRALRDELREAIKIRCCACEATLVGPEVWMLCGMAYCLPCFERWKAAAKMQQGDEGNKWETDRVLASIKKRGKDGTSDDKAKLAAVDAKAKPPTQEALPSGPYDHCDHCGKFFPYGTGFSRAIIGGPYLPKSVTYCPECYREGKAAQ